MTLKHFFLTGAALLAILPAACTSTSTNNLPRADLGFTQMAPVSLGVSKVQVTDSTGGGAQLNPRVSPVEALTRYANRRLKANGGEGTLNFIIQQASLTASEVPNTGNWTENFQLSKPMEYVVTMRIGLDLVDRQTQPNVRSAYTLERKKQLPAGTSLAERDRQLNLMVEDMVKNVDDAVQAGLKNNMHLI